jgi:allantoicase
VAASDEFFAERENLIKPGPPEFTPATFGHKGQVYDGWETRRKRGPGGALPGSGEHDWAVVRLGAPGVIRAVVVDTAFFRGNYPPSCAVDACRVIGYPAALAGPDQDSGYWETANWTEIVPRSPLKGDSQHVFPVGESGGTRGGDAPGGTAPSGGAPGGGGGSGFGAEQRFTHVRLRIYPDGGVARLRVYGEVVPDPALLEGLTFDLAALENGGDITACSDRFYSSPRNVISPGLSRVMGDGWETRRRREAGYEWLSVRLAGQARIELIEIDTSGYLGNAPGAASVTGVDQGQSPWGILLESTPLLPDTPHRFRLPAPVTASHVRLNVFPDGGIARLRVHGSLTPAGLAAVRRRWDETGRSVS